MRTHEIAQAIEKDAYRYFQVMGGLAGKTVGKMPELEWVNAHPSPFPTSAFRFRFGGEDGEARLREAIQKTVAGELPRAWVLGPSNEPRDLEAQLEAQGFSPRVKWSGMAVDLAAVADAPEPLAGVEIRRMTPGDDLREWAEVLTLNLFRREPKDVAPVRDVFACALGDARVQLFGAWSGGRIVATSVLFMENGVAGIHCVSTREDQRNRGIGRRITLEPLLEAKRHGSILGVLQASPLGEPVYRKLGFEEYCRMTIEVYEENLDKKND